MTAQVDAYLVNLPPNQRAALQDLRALIAARLPDHIECMSYAMPGFRQPGPKGKMVAGYAAFTNTIWASIPIPAASSPTSTARPSKLRKAAFFSHLTIPSPPRS